MKKFTCGHCGGRIAVTPRNLGKLVTCPECGKATHPLAADILAAAGEGTPKSGSRPGPPTPALSPELFQRSCENCGRQIGRLEPLQVWDNHLVCPDCHDKLAAPKPSPKPAKARAGRGKQESLPALAESSSASVPVIVERAQLPVAPSPMTGVSIDTAAMRVAVGRVAGAASAVASLPPLQLKHRLLILLAVICCAGVGIYGALTLLRDLAGLITTIALILLAATALVGLIKTGLMLVGRWRTMPKKNAATGSTTEIVTTEGKS
ncbi:hypothetical protein [Humisphaera borealis]|uniref:Uncharacterized protein n=1 Tax=Humisphaera borealis TaxID=2807512 RepID=A0A7M2WWU9_9BACT|nr:hypothetical protein [Humisphaera borealis]QOV89873.1 hypothetical protein IPV69_00415 [Humisphaera borealis]